MTRQLEQSQEDTLRRRYQRLGRAVDGELDDALQADGYELLGFSCKLSGGDCLVTLRLENGVGRFIAFVGSSSLAEALIKATREAKSGGLDYRADRYAK
jgi:hypothetical protein